MYDYTTERPFVFTEEGVTMLLKARDVVNKLIAFSGAFQEQNVHSQLSGDSWHMLACIDYLVERGEIRRLNNGNGDKTPNQFHTPRQFHVYVANV